MIPNLLLYFACGIISDLLVTAYYLFVNHGRRLFASGLSFLIALLNFFILERVLIVDPSILNAISYALGNAMGCLIVMSITKWVDNK